MVSGAACLGEGASDSQPGGSVPVSSSSRGPGRLGQFSGEMPVLRLASASRLSCEAASGISQAGGRLFLDRDSTLLDL